MKNISSVVDRVKCKAGEIFHLAWSPDGRQLGKVTPSPQPCSPYTVANTDMSLLLPAIVGSDETLRITHFLGPSSARSTTLSRYLKPMMPLNYSMPPRDPDKKRPNSLPGFTIR